MTPNDTQQKPVQPVHRRRIPTWVKVLLSIIVAIIIMVAIILVIVNAATKDAVKVSDQLIRDIQANKPAEAYQLTSPIFQKATSEQELTAILHEVSPAVQGKTHITNKSVQKNSGSDQQAIIIYTIDASGGKRYVRVVLQQSNGTWKVVNFRTSETPLTTTEAN